MIKLKALGLLLLLISLSNVVFAQAKPELFSKIERVFKENETAWKVERIYPGNTSDPLAENIVFRSGTEQAAIDIRLWNRAIDAQQVFAGLIIAFDKTMGKRKVKSSLPKFGDESYIWTLPDSSAFPTFMFRKGRVYVSIFAPSTEIAKRFAQHVIDQIEK